ncbi:hypothetical protein B0H17DRAFT_1137083 [Mycena rosella]|uniref:Uncharacterized protein n=1 Tax=Mycena rosella TaxID=1033263 RepID=A0AAD7D9X1_MYCRO|nr:hypothetical protein B0H17DRAFT_1137083 [Mycena rosella]
MEISIEDGRLNNRKPTSLIHQPAHRASSKASSSRTVGNTATLRILRAGRTAGAGPFDRGSAMGDEQTMIGTSVTRVDGSTGAGVGARGRLGVGAKSTTSASLGVLARRARATRRSVRRYAFATRRESREAGVDFRSFGGLRSVKMAKISVFRSGKKSTYPGPQLEQFFVRRALSPCRYGRRKIDHTANIPMIVDGNAQRRRFKVSRSWFELNDSTVATDEDRRRLEDEVEVVAAEEPEDTDSTESPEALGDASQTTLLKVGNLRSVVERSARTGAGNVIARVKLGRGTTTMDSIEAEGLMVTEEASDALGVRRVGIRRSPLLDDAQKDARGFSSEDSVKARRKAGIVFERAKTGREGIEVEDEDIVGSYSQVSDPPVSPICPPEKTFSSPSKASARSLGAGSLCAQAIEAQNSGRERDEDAKPSSGIEVAVTTVTKIGANFWLRGSGLGPGLPLTCTSATETRRREGWPLWSVPVRGLTELRCGWIEHETYAELTVT